MSTDPRRNIDADTTSLAEVDLRCCPEGEDDGTAGALTSPLARNASRLLDLISAEIDAQLAKEADR